MTNPLFHFADVQQRQPVSESSRAQAADPFRQINDAPPPYGQSLTGSSAREITAYGQQLMYGHSVYAPSISHDVLGTERHQQWFLGEPLGAATGEPLRAVHVGPCFLRGGAEQQILDLARFLHPLRVRLERCIVTQQDRVDHSTLARLPIPVHAGGPEAVRQASREYDVVLFWGLAMDQWLEDCRPKLCIYLAHGDGAWTQATLDGSLKVTDHVVAVSRRVQETVCHGAPSTVILNGVDTARLAVSRPRSEVRAALGFGRKDFVVGYLGRFSPEKRPELLLQSLAQMPKHFKALLVGWGPMQNQLMTMANDLIPGRYVFVDACEYLGDFYQAMDAFCLLSSQEGFALVMLEAMMCGLPVVATPVGAVPEVIRDRMNGLIVRAEPNHVAEVLQLLEAEPLWRRALAQQGKRYARRHGHARRMARQYEQLLQQLWDAKSQHRKAS